MKLLAGGGNDGKGLFLICSWFICCLRVVTTVKVYNIFDDIPAVISVENGYLLKGYLKDTNNPVHYFSTSLKNNASNGLIPSTGLYSSMPSSILASTDCCF
jgi:hypothetical protein